MLLKLCSLVLVTTTAFSAWAGDELFSGDALGTAALEQARGRELTTHGFSANALPGAAGETSNTPAAFQSFLEALMASGGTEIYNVAPSQTSGNTLQHDGLSVSGRSSPPTFSAHHHFPSETISKQGFMGVISAVRPLD